VTRKETEQLSVRLTNILLTLNVKGKEDAMRLLRERKILKARGLGVALRAELFAWLGLPMPTKLKSVRVASVARRESFHINELLKLPGDPQARLDRIKKAFTRGEAPTKKGNTEV
jgi:hypothetical protein